MMATELAELGSMMPACGGVCVWGGGGLRSLLEVAPGAANALQCACHVQP
jgi:hypothetical protein